MKTAAVCFLLGIMVMACALPAMAAQHVVYGGNADRVHLRAEPSPEADSLGLYYAGAPLDALGGEENGFLPVRIGAREGYMKAELIAPEGGVTAIHAGEVWADADEAGRTPLYAGPDNGEAVIGLLQGMQRVLVLGQTAEGFYDVSAGSGARGYVAQGDLRLLSPVGQEARGEMDEAQMEADGAAITARLHKAGVLLGRHDGRVHEIEILKNGETAQRLYYICEIVPQDAPHVDVSDMNMDGYPDLIALRTMGASDAYAVYFLYDPQTGLFERSLALEGFSAWRYELSPMNRVIVNNIRESAASVRWEKYQWQGDELILLEHGDSKAQ